MFSLAVQARRREPASLRVTLESLRRLDQHPPDLLEGTLGPMERAARLIKNKIVSREILSDEDVLRAVWPVAVGKVIATHTRPAKLVRNKLVVEVQDAIWQRQLNALSIQILTRLHKTTGNSNVSELEFRIAIPKRQPQRVYTRENEPASDRFVAGGDEADRIQDPVLKKVYQLSRKKATA